MKTMDQLKSEVWQFSLYAKYDKAVKEKEGMSLQCKTETKNHSGTI